ncbi:hypothetical protein LPJ57_003776, partial [Coemansia sp. RSA 486]
MQLLKPAAVIAALAIPYTQGTQLWHDVNRYDASGNECKLQDLSGVVCSQLCVQNLDNCPTSLQPDCPDGQSFCADGQCHDECTDEIQALNPCHCSRSGSKLPPQAADLVPCMSTPNVTIRELRPWQIDEDTRNTCADAVGITDQDASVGVWGKTWIGGDITALWAECPAAPTPNYKYDESYWIATFAVNGALALIIALWSAYKYFAERSVRSWSTDNKNPNSGYIGDKNSPALQKKASSLDEKSLNNDSTESIDAADSGVRLWGYRNNFLGTACVWSIAIVTILWVCYLGVWTADYYGSLPGKRHGVLYSLSYENSKLGLATFLILWAIYFIVLVILFVLKPHLRNYFRVQTLPAQGQFICVERTLHEIKMLIDESNWIQKQVNRLTDALVILLSRDREYTTCPVSRTTQGRHYFTYQCTRYVYDDDMQQYSPFDFELGTSNNELLDRGEGLTSEEAAFRLELIGPNFIEVKVPGVFGAFAREFMSFFYIYQFIFLWAFYYYAYYQVGIVDTGVILISATIKVVMRMQSERRLKRMAEQFEEANVLRDNQWSRISTVDLVPGDVIELETGAHMSCDCILLSGSAVMDESSLTGEPLPIRKFAIQNSDGHYDPEVNKASSLFAGTTVAQVQGKKVVAL